MNICITGASGFVGRFLTDFFIKKGNRIAGVDLRPFKSFAPGCGGSEDAALGCGGPGSAAPQCGFIAADTSIAGEWQEAINAADAVINLAGVNIFGRWNKRRKSAIHDSRVLTTRNVASAMHPGSILVSASAAGIYGNRGDELLTESSPAGDDFLARVCVDWEAGAAKASEKGVRVAITRFGVVLGAGGGALAKMAPAFKLFVGGPLGSGLHWMPWIHIHDLAGAIYHILENDSLSGPFNLCAPRQATNREFVRALGAALNRPTVFKVPALVLKIMLGELGGFLLYSQRTVPQRLAGSGFEFVFPEIGRAMEDVYHMRPKHE